MYSRKTQLEYMNACAPAHKHIHRHTHCIHITHAKVPEKNGMQKSLVCDNHTWKTVPHGIFWQVATFSSIVTELLKMPKDMPKTARLSQNCEVPRSLQSTLLLIST